MYILIDKWLQLMVAALCMEANSKLAQFVLGTAANGPLFRQLVVVCV